MGKKKKKGKRKQLQQTGKGCRSAGSASEQVTLRDIALKYHPMGMSNVEVEGCELESFPRRVWLKIDTETMRPTLWSKENGHVCKTDSDCGNCCSDL